jgi:hypothetical protein
MGMKDLKKNVDMWAGMGHIGYDPVASHAWVNIVGPIKRLKKVVIQKDRNNDGDQKLVAKIWLQF